MIIISGTSSSSSSNNKSSSGSVDSNGSCNRWREEGDSSQAGLLTCLLLCSTCK
jgi:hypothetical protein